MADMPNANRKGALWAAFVGISDYDDPLLGRLSFAGNDASALAALFTDPQRGYPVGSTNLLVQPAAERHLYPTKRNVEVTVRTPAQTAKHEDVVVFGFFGHGLSMGEEVYLCPSDGWQSDPDSLIKLSWVQQSLFDSDARVKILIVDACHSGMFGSSRADDGAMTAAMARTLHELGESEGFVVLSSCEQGEKSYEHPDLQHGVFSYFLLEGLRGAADTDQDGFVTLSEASRFVSIKTREWGFEKRKPQHPVQYSRVVGGDIILLAVPNQSILPKTSRAASVTGLSELTLPEELYLLFADDSSADTNLLAFNPVFCRMECQLQHWQNWC